MARPTGADYNGALGSGQGVSWQSKPERVAAPICDALHAAGGAVAVAAGGTFSAALTSSGRVLVWGKLPGSGLTSSGSVSVSAARSGVAARAAEVLLPPDAVITSIAAGQQHLLLTDGWRVWCVGRWLDEDGEEAGTAPAHSPECLLAFDALGTPLLPDGPPQGAGGLRGVTTAAAADAAAASAARSGASPCITKVVAGAHSSGVLTSTGDLWLWGRLLDAHHGASITSHCGGERHAAHADWSWAGFGGAKPRLVPGLSGVRDAALGGWHALVLVD